MNRAKIYMQTLALLLPILYFTTPKLIAMNIIERVKNIILTPKTEWDKISGEETSTFHA